MLVLLLQMNNNLDNLDEIKKVAILESMQRYLVIVVLLDVLDEIGDS